MNFIERYFTSNEVLYGKALDYLYGLKGKEVNLQKSYDLLVTAADRGYFLAIGTLREVFEPDAPRLNEEFASKYESRRRSKQAEENGDPKACYEENYELLYKASDSKQFDNAYQKVSYAARHNYAPAIYELANIYFHGVGVEKDEELSMKLLKEAASYGECKAIYALYNLGEKKLALKYCEDHVFGDNKECIFLYGSLLYREGLYDAAFNFISEAANDGNGEAMRLLGLMYEHGSGCEADLYTAVSWYQASADTGFVPAYVCLANIYRLGPEGYRDPEAAYELYLRAANEGEPFEWNNVGNCHRFGVGVEKDDTMAIQMYQKGARGENLGLAQYYISQVYLDSESSLHNQTLGLEWLNRAANNGCAPACWELGRLYRDGEIYEQDFAQAYRWFKVAADAGNYKGIIELALMLMNGVVVDKDERKAFELLYDICDENADAMHVLGYCYSKGIGCARNYPRAFRCYSLAAERGCLNAVFDKAVCYRFGEGVPQDFEKAIENYEIAIEHGHPGAMSNCGVLYELGLGVEPDFDRAFALYTRAAELDNPQAQFLLGKLYFEGKKVEQDYNKAVEWLIKAAAQGEPDSLFHLGLCFFEGLGVEQDSFRAIKYLYASADRDWQPAIDFIQQNHIPRPE